MHTQYTHMQAARSKQGSPFWVINIAATWLKYRVMDDEQVCLCVGREVAVVATEDQDGRDDK